MTVLSIIIGAYLYGSIPWGYLLCRIFKNIDIRKYGSGNIGATNVYRAAGGVLAISVLVLDILKGLLPVLFANVLLEKIYGYSEPIYLIAVGIASILGHNFSIFLCGKGGKGVSTSFGVIIGLFPFPALIGLLIWMIVIAVTRYVSVGAITASLSLPVFVHLFYKNPVFTTTGIIISLLIIYTHRANLKRLIEKKENKIKLPWKKKLES
jgi:acyl phosphate:glycerol-3-phosphate acyltransferase